MPDYSGSDFLLWPQTKNLNALFQKSESGVQFPKPTSMMIDLHNSFNPAKNNVGKINFMRILNKLSQERK